LPTCANTIPVTGYPQVSATHSHTRTHEWCVSFALPLTQFNGKSVTNSPAPAFTHPLPPMLSHLHCLKPVLKDMTPPLPSRAPPPHPASLALTLKDATPRVAHGYGYKPALLTCGFEQHHRYPQICTGISSFLIFSRTCLVFLFSLFFFVLYLLYLLYFIYCTYCIYIV